MNEIGFSSMTLSENNIFAQSKVGGAENQKTNIFEMMNKFDEQHKALAGSNGIRQMQPIDQMNQMKKNGAITCILLLTSCGGKEF